jgi:hypothetical protein
MSIKGQSLNRPTLETTGRRKGTNTARASIDLSVSFSNMVRLVDNVQNLSHFQD